LKIPVAALRADPLEGGDRGALHVADLLAAPLLTAVYYLLAVTMLWAEVRRIPTPAPRG